MAASAVAVCNMGLNRLGASLIADLEGDLPNEVLCAEAYPTALDQVLVEHPWSFAIVRQMLAEDAGDNLTPWTYRYQIPHDPPCLRPVTLIDESYEDSEELFEREGDSIYTHLAPAGLKYVTRVDDPTLFPPKFSEALACKIAALVAYPIMQDRNVVMLMEQQYLYELARARAEDNRAARQAPRPEAFWGETARS